MTRNGLSKEERQEQLNLLLHKDPLHTDEALAEVFGVSVHTIRLDRMKLGIPELRERLKNLAAQNLAKVKTISQQELFGQLLDLQLEKQGISLLEITEDMVFQRTGIARGHHIFAQANSLAIALVDAPMALTGFARVWYLRPVYLKEKVIAKAKVTSHRGGKYLVKVTSWIEEEKVFSGKFIVFAKPMDVNQEGNYQGKEREF